MRVGVKCVTAIGHDHLRMYFYNYNIIQLLPDPTDRREASARILQQELELLLPPGLLVLSLSPLVIGKVLSCCCSHVALNSCFMVGLL